MEDDFLYYDENENLQFNKNWIKKVSIPFRNRLILSYKRILLYLLVMNTPYSILDYYAIFVVKSYGMSTFEAIYSLLIDAVEIILLLYIIRTFKFISLELSSLLEVKGAKRGGERLLLRTIIDDPVFYRKLRKSFLNSFYLKGKFDYVAYFLGFLMFFSLMVSDAITRYYASGGDLNYAIWGFSNLPFTLPIPLAIAIFFSSALWMYLLANGLILLWKIFLLMKNVIILRKNVSKLSMKSAIEEFGRIIVEREERERLSINDISKITRYSPTWLISNIFTKIFLKISLILVVVSIVTSIIFYIPQFFGMRYVSSTVLIVYGMSTIFGVLGIAIFTLPLINFRTLFSEYRASLVGIIQDLYEKKIFHYLSVDFEEKDANKEMLAHEISVLQDVIEYLHDLNTLPFTAPQFIKLSTITLVSVLLPYMFDYLLRVIK